MFRGLKNLLTNMLNEDDQSFIPKIMNVMYDLTYILRVMVNVTHVDEFKEYLKNELDSYIKENDYVNKKF